MDEIEKGRQERKKRWMEYVISKSQGVDKDTLDQILKEAEETFDEFNPK